MSETIVKPTEAEVSILVRDFEHRTGIFKHLVKGTAVWQLIRFEVSLRVQGLGLDRAPAGRSRLVGGLAKGLLQYFRLHRAAYFCKTFDSAYRRQTSAGFEDVYFDDLKAVISDMLKVSSCDATGYEDKVASAAHPPAFDDTAVIALSAILGRVLPVNFQSPAYAAISRAIVDEWGYTDYTPARIRRVYNVFWWRSVLYRLLLSRVRPRAVLCPDNGQFGLMRAAQSKGIPYIEMQHGVFTHVHPNALPPDLSDEEAEGILIPQSFAVYGKFSADVLRESWLHINGRVHPVGAPFLERARAIREADYRPGGRPRITLSTQGIARLELGDFVKQFLDLCSDDFELVIKLHPAYDRDEAFYQTLFGDDRRVIIDPGASTNSTHAFIARSDFHVSISSTCHYDALGIGTPTGILKLETYESVLDLLDVEGAMLVETPADLARVVRDRTFGVVPEETSRYFFESNFAQKVEAVLAGLSSKK